MANHKKTQMMRSILVIPFILATINLFSQPLAERQYLTTLFEINNPTVVQQKQQEIKKIYEDLGSLNIPWENGRIVYDTVLTVDLSKERLWHRIQEVCALTYATEIGFQDYDYGRIIYYAKLDIANNPSFSFWPTWIDFVEEISFQARFFVKDGAILIEFF